MNLSDWRRRTYVAVLQALGEGNTPPPPDVAKEMAVSIVAHWSLQCDDGAQEFNFNGAATPVQDVTLPFFVVDPRWGWASQSAGSCLAAYETPLAAARGYVSLLARHYVHALSALQSEPTTATWSVAVLTHGGWVGPSVVADYVSRRQAVALTIG